jgi:Pyrimidine dimer DNA glycosylase
MNIFVVDPDTKICAEALDDLRLNKMIIETAQLLSTAVRSHGSTSQVYNITHLNHPCAIWARHSRENYSWLLDYMEQLVAERVRRTGRSHKSANLIPLLKSEAHLIPSGQFTMWPNCTAFKHIEDVHEAYKTALIDKWLKDKRPPKWTKANKPTWA